MGFHDRGLQHDKTEVFVDSDIHLDETFHQRLIFADSRCDKLHQVVISARNQMTFDDRIYLFDGREKAREIDLAMILSVISANTVRVCPSLETSIWAE